MPRSSLLAALVLTLAGCCALGSTTEPAPLPETAHDPRWMERPEEKPAQRSAFGDWLVASTVSGLITIAGEASYDGVAAVAGEDRDERAERKRRRREREEEEERLRPFIEAERAEAEKRRRNEQIARENEVIYVRPADAP